jgi:hypothetical protein
MVNLGRLLTPALVRELEAKAKEMGAEPFKIWGYQPQK